MLVAGLLPVSTASRGLVIFCYSRKGQGKKGQGKTPKKADQPEEIKGIEKKVASAKLMPFHGSGSSQRAGFDTHDG